jgi:hypothetical protein
LGFFLRKRTSEAKLREAIALKTSKSPLNQKQMPRLPSTSVGGRF